MDVTVTEDKNLVELLKACKMLIEMKRLNMSESAILRGIDKLAEVVDVFNRHHRLYKCGKG